MGVVVYCEVVVEFVKWYVCDEYSINISGVKYFDVFDIKKG